MHHTVLCITKKCIEIQLIEGLPMHSRMVVLFEHIQ